MDEEAIRAALDRMRRPGPPRMEVLWGTADRAAAVGLVPGSFDPMTVAHAALAEALRGLGADLTLFVYSPATPAKEPGPGGEVTPQLLAPEDRVGSLLAYCGTRPALGVALCSHGLYVDQAVAAAEAFPGSRLVIGLGSDKIPQLVDPRWYDDRDAALERLFSLAEVAYAVRAVDEDRLAAGLNGLARWADRLVRLDISPALSEVSSRAVRESLNQGLDVSGLVPSEVLRVLGRT